MPADQNETRTPYLCHVLVCVNVHKSDRKSCAHADSAGIWMQLRTRSRQRWPDAGIRVSQTGCLGVCEDGPNVMIYPQNLWFRQVTLKDIDRILDKIGEIVERGHLPRPA